MRKMHRKIYHMSRAAYREFDWVVNRFLYIPQIHAHTHTHIYTHIYIYMYIYVRTSILYNEQYLHKFLNKSRGQPQQVQAQTRQTLRSLCSSSAGFTSSSSPARISAHCNALIMIIILEALISIWYSVGTFRLLFRPCELFKYANSSALAISCCCCCCPLLLHLWLYMKL